MHVSEAASTLVIEPPQPGWQQDGEFCIEKSLHRYANWLRYASEAGLLPVEHLLPILRCPCPKDLPAFMSRGQVSDPLALREQLKAFEPWGFWFHLGAGVNTRKIDIHGRNRITCRSHLITSSVERLLGTALSSTTVLDMGCHSGFFSLDMASRGVKQVTGVELRPENIRQAEFLKSHYDIANVSFEQGEALSWQAPGSYSVALNLGLLYHVVDPVTLVRRTYEWCSDFAVIDTICHAEPISAFIAAFNKDAAHHSEGLYTAELHPTYRALIDTMHDAGFVDLLELVGDPGENGRVSDLYRNSQRRCIVGFKRPMSEVLAANGVSHCFMNE